MERDLLNKKFITIKRLADGEPSHKLSGLTVKFSFTETSLGEVLVASTPQGVCYMAFAVGGGDMAESEMMNRFPGVFSEIGTDEHRRRVPAALSADEENMEIVPLHLKGAGFQLRVWDELLKIPFGGTATYGEIAAALQNPKAYRVVGTTIGDNPVVVLIPCHRVLRTDGTLSGYHRRSEHKVQLLEREKQHKKAE